MKTMRRLGKRGTVVTGVVLTGALVAGGATAFAASGNSSSGTSSKPAATGQHKAGKAKQRRERRALRLILRTVHGQVTVKNHKTGAYVVREWQRGQVTAVNGDTLTVRSPDGVSWTWSVTKNATITRGGKRIAESTVHSGDSVVMAGHRSGSTNDAGRVFAPSAAQVAKMHRLAASKGGGTTG